MCADKAIENCSEICNFADLYRRQQFALHIEAKLVWKCQKIGQSLQIEINLANED